MTKFLRSGLEQAASFALPLLFAAWLFWGSGFLPLPWPGFVSGILAFIVWYVVFPDASKCLSRFRESREPKETACGAETSLEVELEGVLKLVLLYLVTAIAIAGTAGLSMQYLRANPRIGPLSWVPPFRKVCDYLVDGVSQPANHAALAALCLASLAGALAYSFARAALFPEKNTTHRRGRKVGTVDDAREALKPHRRPNEPEITWGGLGLPWSAGPRHFLAAGMTGSGKTNLLLQFMASVLVWIGKKPDQRALIYDPKTELVSFLHGLGLGERVRILHPFDARGCPWDLAADIEDLSAAQEVASILIPEDKTSKNPFFSRAAGQLLAGVFTFLMKQAPGNWSLRDAIFVMESEARLREVLLRLPETRSLVDEFFQPPETFANVRSEIAIWMRRYRPVAACWHHAVPNGKVSLKDWVASDNVILLGQDEANRFQMEAINRAMFLRASQLLLNRDNSEERRAWVIIDEVREMGNLEGLSRLLTNGRSKGACFCGGYQTPSGMKDAVGEHVADEINDQIWNTALCRMGGDVSAEWASKLVGDVEFEEKQTSEGPNGKSTTTHVVKRRALMPEHFKMLPPPSPETGVSGVFTTPYTGTYSHTVPGSEIANVRSLRARDIEDFIPRPAGHQELPPWTDDDYRRLGLSPEPPPSGNEDTPAEEPPTRLQVVRSAANGTPHR
jgi:hypothetical protein